MAKAKPVVEETQQKKFKGSQLLKMPKYNDRVARIVIKADGLYTLEEADRLIFNFMKKKG